MSLIAVVVSVTTKTRTERRHLLQHAGITAFTASSFEGGWRLVKATHPDLLIADVRLLDYNGLQLAMRARDESPRTRTVIVGEPDLVLEREANALGASYLRGEELPAFVEALHRHA